nr:hypothetical protein [Pseudoalteromonas sp. MMG010]
MFCGASVYCFFKANYCACTKEGDCDNPVTHYWLSAITSAFASLALCCIALHSQYGTLLWLTLMISCFLGGYISAKTNKIKRKKNTKPTSALLTNELN